MAHANGARTVQATAQAGVDSVEHGAYLDREALHAMQEAGTVWVPTLSTIGNLRGRGRFDETAVEQILAAAQENLRRFAALGGLLAPGTDAGAWAVPHASLTEYALFHQVFGEQAQGILERGIAAIQEKFSWSDQDASCGGAILSRRRLPASRGGRNRPEPSHTFPRTDHSDASVFHGW